MYSIIRGCSLLRFQYLPTTQRVSLTFLHPSSFFSHFTSTQKPFLLGSLPRQWYSQKVSAFIHKPSSSTNTSLSNELPPKNQEVRVSKKKTSSVRRAGSAGGGAFSHIAFNDTPIASLSQQSKTVAFCTAEAYDFTKLTQVLSKTPEFKLLPELASDVLHVQARLTPTEDQAHHEGEGELFVFKDGSFVTWGRGHLIGHQFYQSILTKDHVQILPHKSLEIEEMEYIEDVAENTSLTGDTILIGQTPSPALSKLAFSHGLSRSTKVAVLEHVLEGYLNSTRHVPMKLASGQPLKLSRSEILVKIGEVLSVRALLNLSGTAESLLDTPEYYWSRPQLEEYYNKVSKWLDIKPRIAVLNQKLDYAAEFAEVLRAHLSEKHSLKLEWFIIILIAVEVGFEILHWCEKLGYLNVVKPLEDETL
ncbi:hypothetical protein HMI54_005903 [Coelomomyces lativittatus]|nr:hypothetical protein HMI54_005903 [Coelomomyces lativittatus]KAJ1505605.1 hypothetical protein HMI55_001532 [Coelomomyces lativittatus]KAJ1505685.1 hypothetical protein HMI56_000993 [Coelomomyces lativittatus]